MMMTEMNLEPFKKKCECFIYCVFYSFIKPVWLKLEISVIITCTAL